MNTRERKQARAERLRGWAETRQERAHAQLTSNPEMRHDWAFITQPGRIVARERMNRADDRAFQSLRKANDMERRAQGIEAQLDGSIYSDDVDAIERLEERIAELETQRDAMKSDNAAFRKAHRAELAALSPYARDQAMPHQGYELTNLGANIRRNRQRLDDLRAATSVTDPRPLRVILARRDGTCKRCGEPIEVGAYIGKYADGWSHVSGTPWARCNG